MFSSLLTLQGAIKKSGTVNEVQHSHAVTLVTLYIV